MREKVILPLVFRSALLLTLLTGCQKQNEEVVVRFTFAYQDRVADAAAIVAVRKGYFEAEGLSVQPRMFTSGPECTEALISGNAEFATMGDTTAIIVAVRGGDAFRIVCTHGGGEKRHRIIAARGTGLGNISELVNKKIGVKKGTSTHGGLLLLAKAHGIDITDEIIDMPPSLQLTALAAGELDAIVASEPTPSQAEVGGLGYELSTLGGLGPTYPILLMVKRTFAQKHPDIVRKVILALVKAGQFIKESPDAAAEIQSKITGLRKTTIRKAMALHDYEIKMDDATKRSLKQMATFLKDIRRIEKAPDFDMVIDESYVKGINEAFGRK
jgi:ABC-type nitrate/sulfonate/bicarbonate transport system substrate-binding protein